MTKAFGMAAGLLGATLCGLLGATGAWAQEAGGGNKPSTLKLGVFLPPSGNIRRAAGDTWFSAGVEYAPRQSGGGAGGGVIVAPLGYADYATINRHGVNADFVGFGGGARFYGEPTGVNAFDPYITAGGGVYFSHLSGRGDSTNLARIGFRLGVGLEFQRIYVVEATYTDAGSIRGNRVDGLNLQAGIRF
jgi:hypothetical protein